VSELGVLESFVPRDLLLDLEGDDPRAMSARRFSGAAMFADVSGFSRLADRLFRRYGGRGGELLTGMLTDFFGHLVEVTLRHHGEIVKWSGDAFLAIWRDEEHEGLAVAAAAACAHELAAHTLTPEQVPDVTLRVRAAVTAGELFAARVGGHEGRWEIVVAGDPIRQIARVLAAAPASSAALSPEAALLLGEVARLSKAPPRRADRGARASLPPDAGIVFVNEAPPTRAHRPRSRRALGASDRERLRAHVPESVLGRLDGGLDGWFAERRHVTSSFLLARGFDPAIEGGAERLHLAVRASQEAFARHGGVLAQAGADDKGIWFLGAFGLPPTRSEVRADHALLATWDARRALAALGVPTSGGVASGRAFCGIVGSARRRELTFTSRVVNLSARLMSRTQADVLVDAATASRARQTRLVPRAPESFAGFAEPVATFALEGPLEEGPQSGEREALGARRVWGRGREREVLRAAVEAVARGDRRCVVVEGEAGIGKTVLLDEAARAGAAVARVVRGSGERAASASPYAAFGAVLAALLDVPTHVHDDVEQRKVEQRFLAMHPELAEQAALFNGILPVSFPDGEATRGLTGVARAESTRRVLLGVLEQHAAAGPLVLVLDDVHWLDGMSWKLLVTAVAQIERLAALLSSRPGVSSPDRGRLLDLPHAELLSLSAVDLETVAKMAAPFLELVEEHPLPEHVSRWLMVKSGGNPFFVQELASKIAEDGLVEVVDGELRRAPSPAELEAVAVPVDVESVVTSRVDRLDVEAQWALKSASVVGRVFDLALLQKAHPKAPARQELRRAVTALELAELVEPHGSDGHGDDFRFSHDTIQRVAYELLADAQRREMHAAVARELEVVHGDDPAHVPALAQHWDATSDDGRAIEALERAAQQSLRAGAFAETNHFLVRLQARVADMREHGRTPVSVDATREAAWARDRAEASFQIGRIAESCAEGERSLALLGRSVPTRAAGWGALALGQLVAQAWQRWFGARAEAESPVARAMLKAVGRLAEAYVFANQPQKMIAVALWAANQAPRAGAGAPLAQPYAILGMTAGMMRLDRLAARYFALAEEAATASGEPTETIGALFLQSLYRQGFGHLSLWRELLDRGFAIASRAQIDHQADMLRMGMGFHAWTVGRYRESLRLIEETRASAQRRYDEQLAGWCTLSAASCLQRLGEFEEALKHLDRAGKLLEKLGDVAIQTNVDGLRCLVALRLGDPTTARAILERQLAVLEAGPPSSGMAITAYESLTEAANDLWAASQGRDAELGKLSARAVAQMDRFAGLFPIGKPTATFHRGRRTEIAGSGARAVAAYRTALESARTMGLPWGEAAASAALARCAPEAERAAHAANARALFEKLEARFELARLHEPSAPARLAS
jgi:class 3 adenylate cyclase/tetratricopeptide (TPR) repeat protein